MSEHVNTWVVSLLDSGIVSASLITSAGQLLAFGSWGHYGLCNCLSLTAPIDAVNWPCELMRRLYEAQQ